MTTYVVINKATQAEVYRYAADAPVEWQGMEFDTHDHNVVPEVAEPEVAFNPTEWYIGVGPFYDRFGAYKMPILASTDPLVQAIIKDSSVRKYLDLKGRRADLLQAVQALQSKGFALNAEAILDVQPGPLEVYRG